MVGVLIGEEGKGRAGMHGLECGDLFLLDWAGRRGGGVRMYV